MAGISTVKTEKQRKKIETEIMVQIGRVVLIIFLLAGALMGLTIASVSMEANQTEIALNAESASWEISSFFEKYVSAAETVALEPNIRMFVEKTGAYEEITSNEYFQPMMEYIQNVASNSEDILSTWVADLDASAAIVSTGDITEKGFDITSREWYACVSTGQYILTEPYIDTITGDRVVTIAVPVKKNGQVLGISGIDVSLGEVASAMQKHVIGENGFSVLLSAKGNVVYAPSEAILMMNIADLNVNQEAIDAVNKKIPGNMEISFGPEKEYASFAVVGDTGYMVLSVLPYAEYTRSLVLSILGLALVCVVGSVAILINIKRSAQKITKPIVALNGIAQKLVEGDLDVAVSVSVNNEIGELSESIAKTVGRLKEYIVYIEEISTVLKDMADGKLRVVLKNDYKGEFSLLKDAIVNISESMSNVILQIHEGADHVASGSDELANVSQNLAEGANTQAAAVHNLADIANKIVESVEENRTNAESAANEMNQLTAMMNQNQKLMDEMMEAMEKIKDTSQEVVGIIQAIEEIAEQTNLLSLNASIEAARAGESGRGFAVVAGEIGKLADHSSEAANTTKRLIEVSMQQIEKGNQLAAQVLVSLKNAVSAFGQVDGMIEQTVTLAVAQAKDMQMIRAGVDELAQGVGNNSAMAEESSATSQELASQAIGLKNMIDKFEC